MMVGRVEVDGQIAKDINVQIWNLPIIYLYVENDKCIIPRPYNTAAAAIQAIVEYWQYVQA